jgi:hypothetical protein
MNKTMEFVAWAQVQENVIFSVPYGAYSPVYLILTEAKRLLSLNTDLIAYKCATDTDDPLDPFCYLESIPEPYGRDKHYPLFIKISKLLTNGMLSSYLSDIILTFPSFAGYSSGNSINNKK